MFACSPMGGDVGAVASVCTLGDFTTGSTFIAGADGLVMIGGYGS